MTTFHIAGWELLNIVLSVFISWICMSDSGKSPQQRWVIGIGLFCMLSATELGIALASSVAVCR